MAEAIKLDFESVDNGKQVSGLVYIKDYTTAPRKNGGKYIRGTLALKSKRLGFSIFDESLVKGFETNSFSNQVANVNATVNEYKGTINLIINSLGPACDYDISVFIDSHDVVSNHNKLNEYLMSKLSADELSIVNEVFAAAPDGLTRFTQEYAGASYHDACIGGLEHHTLKMLRLFEFCAENDYRFNEFDKSIPHFKSLCRLGILFHDLGKIVEMNDGVYTAQSIVTHRVVVLEWIFKVKDKLIKLYGEDEYYILLSIITQHHGTFEGDVPKTVAAEVVHLIDNFDAQISHLIEGVLSGGESSADGSHYVRLDTLKLRI